MKSIKLIYIVFAFLIVIAGCRKDEKTERQIIEDPTGNPTIEVVSGVTGLVTDENDNPISNATVTVYDKEVSTDENGIFYINNEGLRESRTPVRVEKADYFDGFKSFIPALGSKSFLQFKMVRKDNASTILSSEGGTVELELGAAITFPANGITYKDGGDVYSGSVAVYTHWYDPASIDLGLTMPGNLLGITEDGNEVQLGTYGMIAIEMVTPNGASLQLADDARATLRFPVSDNLNPPETSPLWSFDESDGVWMQEGEATLENGFYIAEVSHFSFWNCDVPYPLITLEGQIVRNGTPVANIPVFITLENVRTGYGYTDNEGVFRGKVPRDEELSLFISHCGETIASETIGPFNEDTNLGLFETDAQNFVTVLMGRMVDCFENPLANAYGLVREGEKITQIITPLADGTFSMTLLACGSSNFTVQFYDPVNIKVSEIFDISKDVEVNEFNTVRVCDDVDEFIQFTIDGELQPLLEEADVYYSNGEKLIVRSFEPNANYQFEMDLFASIEGKYNPSNVFIRGFNPALTPTCGDIIQNVVGCDEFDVNISSFTDYVTGTFEGTLVRRRDSVSIGPIEYIEQIVTGSFRVKIDDNITTGSISGQLWFDENGNNTRDDNENKSTNPQRLFLDKISGDELNLFPTIITVYERFYTYTNLVPGTYVIRAAETNEFDIVANDIGNDDRDSDFIDLVEEYATNELVIIQDEKIENVDLGFAIPDSLICGELISTGCAPNIQLFLSVSSGVPPYTATLNGEQIMTFDQLPIFNVQTGGDYTLQVTDALDHTCFSQKYVESYKNEITGIVWRDIDGGTPNVFDGNDERLVEVNVNLLNINGEFITDVLTNNDGSYTFNNLAPGIYFIEIVEIGSLQYLVQNTNVFNGNDINPDSGRSDEIGVEGCNNSIRIDAGLK